MPRQGTPADPVGGLLGQILKGMLGGGAMPGSEPEAEAQPQRRSAPPARAGSRNQKLIPNCRRPPPGTGPRARSASMP